VVSLVFYETSNKTTIENQSHNILNQDQYWKEKSLPFPHAQLSRLYSTTPSNRDQEESPSETYNYVVGTNEEPCHLSGSICAERAALVQLRFLPNVKVTKVIVCTDARDVISPGMLCREFMASHPGISYDLPIIISCGVCRCCGLDISGGLKEDECKEGVGDTMLERVLHPCAIPVHKYSTNAPSQTHDFVATETTLRDLYPHPSIYTKLNGKQSSSLGIQYLQSIQDISSTTKAYNNVQPSTQSHTFLLHNNKTSTIEKTPSTDTSISSDLNNTGPSKPDSLAIQQVTKAAIQAAQTDKHPQSSTLHPIQYGAAILFEDGTLHTSTQKKALEYGCSYDAVGQLANIIETKSINTPTEAEGLESKIPIRPMLLCQSDQYGIFHPPFATARAFLSEHGYGNCWILYHSFTGTKADRQGIINYEKEDKRQQRPSMTICLIQAKDLAPDPPVFV